ncbi:hypothetical protein [Bacteriovorax sp. DB6_IX]|uniref:hypothetical protein n=1 Tax=Bacteriovorax sp. DB6_IX TaxID=1353530 RepID=UPI00038A20D1|nr:hypothetical protein [Bacteriovorax sp. DB6_IX]EQC44147.1 hypothetical protein M901_2917 [Bacteriovorax sp. DB6_IX]
MKKLLVLLTTLVSVNILAHCPLYFSAEDLCADLEWTNGPAYNVESGFEVSFWRNGDHNHELVSPEAEVSFRPWMIMSNGHSHGGPAMTWQEVEAGLFEINDARFIGGMMGYWQVLIKVGDEELAVKVEIE